MSVDVSVILLNYRTPDLTINCLRSIEPTVEPWFKVLAVDNDSGDGSAEKIERAIAERGWSGWARLLRSPRNGGYSYGNNYGIRAQPARAYILLNSDTLVNPGTFRGLRDAMQRFPRAGLIGPAMLDGHGVPDQSFFRQPAPVSEFLRSSNTGVFSKLLDRYDLILPRREGPMEVDWLGFACVLIRQEVVEQVGMLDDAYFMYFEDIDYCSRARDAGWTVLYLPEPQIVHLGAASSKVFAGGALLRRAPRYYYESRSRYFAKFYGRRGLWLANAFWYLGRCVSWPRELAGREPTSREREAADLWINAVRPLRAPPRREA
jgi:N-acetylglucosaminyl-diphospho-decaprenol L-rhamnosyltransferase